VVGWLLIRNMYLVSHLDLSRLHRNLPFPLHFICQTSNDCMPEFSPHHLLFLLFLKFTLITKRRFDPTRAALKLVV
jgi:hypothetical protein